MNFQTMKFGIYFLVGCLCLPLYAAYWDTLPKNVRTMVYRQVYVPKLQGKFNDNQQYESYRLNLNLDAETLYDVSSITEMYFDELKKISETAYEQFSFGEFKGRADVDMRANVLGLGWGLTDRLTAYCYLPYYEADVNIKFWRTAENNHLEVAQSIEDADDRTDLTTLLSGLTENLFDVNERTIQSVIVNYFGYKPLGSWHAKGFGDLEVGMMYRLTEWENKGMLASLGVVLPTGREDNPDILQDISFGDGQWDAFSEFGGGIRFWDSMGIDSWVRYTYQMPYRKMIRLPESASFPLTKRVGVARIKPGNKIDFNLRLNTYPWSFLTFSPYYTFSTRGLARYQSAFFDADQILRENSNMISHVAGSTLSLSTVNWFKEKSFPLPLELSAGVLSVFSGKNTEQYTRYDFEIRFYF